MSSPTTTTIAFKIVCVFTEDKYLLTLQRCQRVSYEILLRNSLALHASPKSIPRLDHGNYYKKCEIFYLFSFRTNSKQKYLSVEDGLLKFIFKLTEFITYKLLSPHQSRIRRLNVLKLQFLWNQWLQGSNLRVQPFFQFKINFLGLTVKCLLMQQGRIQIAVFPYLK